jgi:SAM-dependent methyltransferase
MKLNEYRKFYEFSPGECPCDFHFAEYMKKNLRKKNIFHYGTGGHHYIGLKNSMLDEPNDISGITLQQQEYQSYINLLKQNPMLTKHYKVSFVDFYTLSESFLPKFDIVNLFHLCEYYVEGMPYYTLNDRTALSLFARLLKKNGTIFFYRKSSAFSRVRKIIDDIDFLEKSVEYESLLGYKAV